MKSLRIVYLVIGVLFLVGCAAVVPAAPPPPAAQVELSPKAIEQCHAKEGVLVQVWERRNATSQTSIKALTGLTEQRLGDALVSKVQSWDGNKGLIWSVLCIKENYYGHRRSQSP